MEQKAHSKAIKWAAVGSVLAAATVIATAAVAQEVLPRPEPPFRGKIGRTTKDSKPDFPKEIPEGGTQGMLVTQGGRFSGYGLYLLDGRPVFLYNLAGVARYQVAGRDQLPAGKHTIMLDFKYDGGGIGKGGLATLTVDGQQAAAGRIKRTLPFRISLDETLDIGEDTGTPVCEYYVEQMPFKFTGTLKQVVINIGQEKLSSENKKAVEEARNLCEAARQWPSLNAGRERVSIKRVRELRIKIINETRELNLEENAICSQLRHIHAKHCWAIV